MTIKKVWLAVGFGGLIAGVAWAATGDLTPQECFSDKGGSEKKCKKNKALANAYDVVVSPDGESVYVAGLDDSAIAIYDRDLKTGALTYKGCIQDHDTGTDHCSHKTAGLDGARAIALGDDHSVYVVSAEDDALVWFTRNANHRLIPRHCWQDDDAPSPEPSCTPVHALNGARQVTVSSDGNSVYVAGHDDNAVAIFVRASNGDLRYFDCVDDNDVASECDKSAKGLSHAHSVVVSQDGTSVDVAGAADNAIVTFRRDSSSSELFPKGCIDDEDVNPDGGANQAQGLGGARSIAISSNDQFVYVAGYDDNAIAMFSRDTSSGPSHGALTKIDCIDDTSSPIGCSYHANGLSGVHEITIGPNGHLYAASRLDNAVSWFEPDGNGILTGLGCVQDADLPPGTGECALRFHGLGAAHAVAASSDNLSVYVASGGAIFGGDSAMVRLDVDQ